MDKELKPCPVCKTTDHPKSTNKGHLCRPCAKNRTERWIEANPEKFFFNQLKSKYGIEKEQYLGKLIKQGGRCKICLEVETDIDKRTGKVKGLAVDHNHETGQIRDLLCKKCNTALGLLKEDPKRIQNMLNYLDEHNGY
jgi:hypothetical protein